MQRLLRVKQLKLPQKPKSITNHISIRLFPNNNTKRRYREVMPFLFAISLRTARGLVIACRLDRLAPFRAARGLPARGLPAYSTGEKEAVSVMSSLTVSVREVLVFPSLQERN